MVFSRWVYPGLDAPVRLDLRRELTSGKDPLVTEGSDHHVRGVEAQKQSRADRVGEGLEDHSGVDKPCAGEAGEQIRSRGWTDSDLTVLAHVIRGVRATSM